MVTRLGAFLRYGLVFRSKVIRILNRFYWKYTTRLSVSDFIRSQEIMHEVLRVCYCFVAIGTTSTEELVTAGKFGVFCNKILL